MKMRRVRKVRPGITLRSRDPWWQPVNYASSMWIRVRVSFELGEH